MTSNTLITVAPTGAESEKDAVPGDGRSGRVEVTGHRPVGGGHPEAQEPRGSGRRSHVGEQPAKDEGEEADHADDGEKRPDQVTGAPRGRAGWRRVFLGAHRQKDSPTAK